MIEREKESEACTLFGIAYLDPATTVIMDDRT